MDEERLQVSEGKACKGEEEKGGTCKGGRKGGIVIVKEGREDLKRSKKIWDAFADARRRSKIAKACEVGGGNAGCVGRWGEGGWVGGGGGRGARGELPTRT